MKGTISIEMTVWCGGENCNEWTQQSSSKKSHIARLAKEWGWKKTKKHGWLCPNCLKHQAA